jgi:hypothetical protein
VDVFDTRRSWRVSLFTPSDQPMRFSSRQGAWRAGRHVRIGAGGTLT